MRNTVLILEDNPERLGRLLHVLSAQQSHLAVRHWPDAPGMLAELPSLLPSAALISLDHDLESMGPSAADPGTGLDVARWLATQEPACPTIIHSSNRDRALWMLGELQLVEWDCRRVAPIGSDWVEADWAVVVGEMLRAA